MRTGIFGGSFNPPHLAHLIVAESVREEFKLDRVLWIPSAQPPHKEMAAMAPASDRLAMVRLAVADNPAFEVSEVELRRQGPSFTIETVLQLKQDFPDEDLYLIVGGDSLSEFHTWRNPDRILAEVSLIAYHRAGSVMPDRYASSNRILESSAPRVDVSSTAIRDRLAEGRSVRYLLPGGVIDYVHAQNLYRT